MDYSVIASPASLASDVEQRLVKALEPVDVVMSDIRIDTGLEVSPPPPWQLFIGLTLAAVVTVLGDTITSSATELRPDPVRLHRMSLPAHWDLTAARNWSGDIPVVVGWPAVSAVLALTATVGALAAPRRIGSTPNRTEA